MSKSTCYKEWKKQVFHLPTTKTTLSLTGYSRGADKTSFFVKELKCFLDGGIVDSHKATHVFLTHCHQDHSMAVPTMLTRLWTLDIYCPVTMTKPLDNYILAASALNDPEMDEQGPRCQYNIHGMRTGDQASLPRDYTVRVIKCDHSVDCVGYLFSHQKSKLKEKYQVTLHLADDNPGLPGKELGALRNKGVELTDTITTPAFAFMGDTTSQVFRDHPEVFQASLIIVECSFIDPEHESLAVKKKHMHWLELRPYVVANPTVTFVLTHWSHRYNKAQILEFFEKEDISCLTLRVGLDNVVPWVGDEES